MHMTVFDISNAEYIEVLSVKNVLLRLKGLEMLSVLLSANILLLAFHCKRKLWPESAFSNSGEGREIGFGHM